VEFDDYYVIQPEFPFWSSKFAEGGKELLDGFEYTSDKNKHWLTIEELRELAEEVIV